MMWGSALVVILAGGVWTFMTSCQVVRSPPEPGADSGAVLDQTPGLAILASGARRFELVDPLGRRLLHDVRTSEIIAEIPGASVEALSSEHDSGANQDDSFSGYGCDVPMALDGHYTVRVAADSGLSMSVTAYDDRGVFASESAIDTTASPTSNSYDILYSGTARSVVVRKRRRETPR